MFPFVMSYVQRIFRRLCKQIKSDASMQFAGTFNVYRSLRLAADTALRPGGQQGARRGLFSDNISFDSPV